MPDSYQGLCALASLLNQRSLSPNQENDVLRPTLPLCLLNVLLSPLNSLDAIEAKVCESLLLRLQACPSGALGNPYLRFTRDYGFRPMDGIAFVYLSSPGCIQWVVKT
jgi:hypothetical protein